MSFNENPDDPAVISVSALEKTFRMYKRPQDRLKQMVLPRLIPVKTPRKYFETFTALKDVSLTLKRGETVGIVGRNGSGKSTLLQIICGTLQPTSGHVNVNGRIAALLELGAGFNPEFTGRENVYLNGAIIGMTQDEIDACFDDIARFANIGQFMDQPTKSYSSGMYVRLAFSVAIHANPDILVVDEALSVGDESFQRKCFARIEDMQSRGATILFVSHSAQAVIELCDRAILLDDGEVLISGAPKRVVGQYQRLMNLTGEQAASTRETIKRMGQQDAAEPPVLTTKNAPPNSTAAPNTANNATPQGGLDPSWYDPQLVSTSAVNYEPQGAEIKNPHLRNAAGQQVNYIAVGRRYTITYDVNIHKGIEKPLFGFFFKTVSGVELAGANNIRVPYPQVNEAASGDTVNVEFDFNCYLMPGTYFLTVGIMAMIDSEYIFLHRIIDALAIRVMEGTNNAHYDAGLAALETELRTKKAGNKAATA